MAALSCSPASLKAVVALVGDATATGVCASQDVAALGPTGAALRYLAQQTAALAGAAGAGAGAAASPQLPLGHQALSEVSGGLDASFLLFSGYLVFLMQAGFAVLCAGHIRTQNNANILLKNLVDCAVGTLAWFLLGNGLAYGEHNGQSNGFIGSGDFAVPTTKGSHARFFFTWAFSAAAATIVAGAVAERIAFTCYLGYSTMMSAFVYPVVVHWLWTRWGWLSPFSANPLLGSGAIDFAGGVVVHTVGGTAALLGTVFCGTRLGRFNMMGEPQKGFRENNSNLVVLGTFLLWFGWYGFNPGSAAAVSTEALADVASRAAVATTIAAGSGGLAVLLATYVMHRRFDVMQLCNGVLCGLVAITPGCGVVDPWAGIIIAALGACVFVVGDAVMLRYQLDDVVSAVPMHLGCGVVGTLAVGFFAQKEYVYQFYGLQPTLARRWGVLFGGDGRLLACQIIAILVAIAWVVATLGPYFFIMKRLGLCRVPVEQELAGLDASKYGVITTNELPTATAGSKPGKSNRYI